MPFTPAQMRFQSALEGTLGLKGPKRTWGPKKERLLRQSLADGADPNQPLWLNAAALHPPGTRGLDLWLARAQEHRPSLGVLHMLAEHGFDYARVSPRLVHDHLDAQCWDEALFLLMQHAPLSARLDPALLLISADHPSRSPPLERLSELWAAFTAHPDFAGFRAQQNPDALAQHGGGGWWTAVAQLRPQHGWVGYARTPQADPDFATRRQFWCEALMAQGVDPNAYASRDPHHWPVFLTEDPSILVAAGARWEAPGVLPLHLAANRVTAMAMRWFLAQGADPMAVDAGGNTPLHAVLRQTSDDGIVFALHQVNALLAAGARTNVVNLAGEAVWDLCDRTVFRQDLQRLVQKAEAPFVAERLAHVIATEQSTPTSSVRKPRL